jgi:MinD superfamily P-loop ATPase
LRSWIVAMDVKYPDVEKMPDKSIHACPFNSAIQTSQVDEAICHGCRRCEEIYTFHASSELRWSSPNVSDYF